MALRAVAGGNYSVKVREREREECINHGASIDKNVGNFKHRQSDISCHFSQVVQVLNFRITH